MQNPSRTNKNKNCSTTLQHWQIYFPDRCRIHHERTKTRIAVQPYNIGRYIFQTDAESITNEQKQELQYNLTTLAEIFSRPMQNPSRTNKNKNCSTTLQHWQ